jgi:ubiquinone/menaquinone biosynthesis C-methylase UbiE
MNYGYQSLNGEPPLILEKDDEINRYCIQLYDFVVSKVQVKDKDVLEVGSGRGGGASYITRYYKPKSYIAMDISSGVINFCNNYHKVNGLKFIVGVAEEPPFPDNSFDIVVNVESARCYKSIKKFFEEVNRMLRPGGHFCFADMIKKGEYDAVRADLLASGMEIISETNISQNVVKALDFDNERREAIIAKKVPKFLKKAFFQFAGTKGTERYESFANGKMEYWNFVLRKK